MRAWLEAGRVSNLPTVWSNVAAGWWLAGASWGPRLAVLLVGASLLYTAGMLLNDAFDARWDAIHRTSRPIPSGRLSAFSVWAAGWAMLLAGAGLAAAACGERESVCLLILGLLVGAIVLYDWLHKKSPWTAVLMATCRFLLVMLAGAAASTGVGFPPSIAIWSLAVAGAVLTVTLVARREARPADLGLSPIVIAGGFLSVTALGVTALGWKYPGWVMAFLAISLGWMLRGVLIIRDRRDPTRIGRAVGHWLAGLIPLDAVAIASVDPTIGCYVLAMLPAALWWQRWIPAT